MRTVIKADRVVQMLADQNTTFGHAKPECLRLNLHADFAERDCVIVAHDPFLLIRKYLVQIRAGVRDKRRSHLLGRHCEVLVMGRNPFLAQELVRSLQSAGFAQT